MLLTASAHLIGHFQAPDTSTEEKKALVDSMNNVQFQMDSFFSRSILDLFNAFSLYFSVQLFLLALVCFVIVRSNPNQKLIKKLSLTILVGMLVLMALSFKYAFSVPIMLFLIIALLMTLSYFKVNVE